jgi:ribosomal protein S18 acetylase RimI-like enzyme
MENISFTLKPMQLNHVKDGMRLSIGEGWNQTESDWRFLLETQSNICIAVEAGNKIIATTTATNYSNKVAWIGMVLVDKEYRGMGVSKLLLTEILRKTEKCDSVKLDATAAGQKVYKKFGFKEEHFITRMIRISAEPAPELNDKSSLVQPVQSKDVDEIIERDETVFGADRSNLIKYLIKNYPGSAWVIKRNSEVASFALGRDGNKYHQAGPVFAPTTADAKMLISKALQALNNTPAVIDVLTDKKDLIDWLHSIGFTEQRRFVRMYKAENPLPGEINKQYAICGPEFG